MSGENTQTYTDIDAYKLPTGPREYSRLDDQHAVLYTLLGNRITHASLRSPKRILDIGCGTGACTRDFATQNPSARVYGLDLTPVPQSHRAVSPPNVEFITGDVRNLAGVDERLGLCSFDYVFSRLLIYGMTDWPAYVKRAAQLAAPGGFVEMHDIDLRMTLDGAPKDPEWLTIVRGVAQEKGMDLTCGSKVAGYMRDAGLIEVEAEEYPLPVGTWMKDTRPETEAWGNYIGPNLGRMQWHFVKVMLGGDARWSEGEVRRLQVQAYESMQPTPGLSFKWVVTVGRKSPI